MAVTKISILIATTSSRAHFLLSLMNKLQPQIAGKPVEIVVNANETDVIGKKRNDMVLKATGEYVIHLDVDDEVPKYYVDKLLVAVETKPDCVGINGIMTTNGKDKRQWFISMDYKDWSEKNKVYLRTTNHITAVKRDIALKVPFPEVKFGEDYAYSMALKPHLKTEVKIKEPMYHYKFVKDKNY